MTIKRPSYKKVSDNSTKSIDPRYAKEKESRRKLASMHEQRKQFEEIDLNPAGSGDIEQRLLWDFYQNPHLVCEEFTGWQPPPWFMAPFLASLKCYPAHWRPYVNTVTCRSAGKTETLIGLTDWFAITWMPLLMLLAYGIKASPAEVMAQTGKPLVQILLVTRRIDNSRRLLSKIKGNIENDATQMSLFYNPECWKKDHIRTKTGGEIVIHPPDDSLRGYHGGILHLNNGTRLDTPCKLKVDESAFVPNLYSVINEIALKFIGGEIMLTTTPYGKFGVNYDAWEGKMPRKFANFTASQIPRLPDWPDGQSFRDMKDVLREVRELKALGMDLIIRQEIEGQFADDASLFIRNHTWLNAMDSSLDNPDIGDFRETMPRAGKFIIGFDPNSGSKSRGADPCAICIRHLAPNGRRSTVLSVRKFYRKDIHWQVNRLVDWIQMLTPRRLVGVYIDQGYGHAYPELIASECRHRELSMGSRKVVLVPPSQELSYMQQFRAGLEMGVTSIPDDQEFTREQQSLIGFGTGGTSDDRAAAVQLKTTGKSSNLPDMIAATALTFVPTTITNTGVAGRSDNGKSKAFAPATQCRSYQKKMTGAPSKPRLTNKGKH